MKINYKDINYKRAICTAIIISILIFVIVFSVFWSIIPKCEDTNVGKRNEELYRLQEVQSQNLQFEQYFGDNKSASEVKQLMSFVRANNIVSTEGHEKKNISIIFNSELKKPEQISQQIDSKKTYRIGVLNDFKSDDSQEMINNSQIENGYEFAGYYTFGFIKTISIVEN